jgi:3-oxoacyl-[acyl-carrier-protein] synthase II
VTGLGLVSAAGESVDSLREALDAGAPLVREVTAFETSEGWPTRCADAPDFDLARHVPSVRSYVDRTSALALAAAKAALEDAGVLDEGGRGGREAGLAYGTEWGCLDSMELFYAKLEKSPRFAPPLPFSHSYANSPASVLAIEFRLRGHHVVYSTGRTSGAWALLGGADAVALGRTALVACAASDSFSRAAFRHYLAAGKLLPDGVKDPRRDAEGRFILGEGGACLVLEEERAARARGADVKAALAGSGVAALLRQGYEGRRPFIAPKERRRVAAGGDRATALERAAGDALARAGVSPGDVKAIFGTSPDAAGAEVELSAAASALGMSAAEARAMTVATGLVLGETMAASAVLAAAAACAGRREGAALVLCAQGDDAGASAIALVLAPA